MRLPTVAKASESQRDSTAFSLRCNGFSPALAGWQDKCGFPQGKWQAVPARFNRSSGVVKRSCRWKHLWWKIAGKPV